MTQPVAVSLVIPIYNEAASASRLAGRLEAIRARMGNTGFEVILVDDGSTDETAQQLARLQDPAVTVVRHPSNRGYGAALKTGIRVAKGAWVAITDADETYPDERIPEFCSAAVAEDLDMLVGARTGERVHIPLLRRFPKWFLNRLANWLSGRTIPDMNSGLRVMRKSVVEQFVHVLPNGFSFTTTITLAMLSRGYRVEYRPINYERRTGRSKIRPIQDTLNFMQLIVRTVLWFNPLRVFIPLASTLFLLGILVAVGSYWLTGKVMDVTVALAWMTGVMVLSVGMLADLIDKRL